eukprot:GHVU01066280.1.p2 GENE.GHVU01066280.1~~GHVU01066280.1.p2  ORF type:complete len:148 (-),score=20.06 GHVU01066280.1:367-747(-)
MTTTTTTTTTTTKGIAVAPPDLLFFTYQVVFSFFRSFFLSFFLSCASGALRIRSGSSCPPVQFCCRLGLLALVAVATGVVAHLSPVCAYRPLEGATQRFIHACLLMPATYYSIAAALSSPIGRLMY